MIEFKLPELGENIEQGDLVRLMVEPGASVSTGQSVMELETDKAVVEVPSSVSGTVQEIRVKEGDKIKVGQVIFTVDGAEGKASAEPSAGTPRKLPRPFSRNQSKKQKSSLRRLPRQPLPRPHRGHRPPLHRQLFQKLPERANSNCPNSAKTFPRAIWFV